MVCQGVGTAIARHFLGWHSATLRYILSPELSEVGFPMSSFSSRLQTYGWMVEGYLNTYLEYGWLPEWPSPGNRGSMVCALSFSFSLSLSLRRVVVSFHSCVWLFVLVTWRVTPSPTRCTVLRWALSRTTSSRTQSSRMFPVSTSPSRTKRSGRTRSSSLLSGRWASLPSFCPPVLLRPVYVFCVDICSHACFVSLCVRVACWPRVPGAVRHFGLHPL